jgi:tetratricopeptide (TPR) repeat protein
LYTTWNVSLQLVEQHSMLSSQLLRFWAYFDHQDLWYELLREGHIDGPGWLSELTRNELTFTQAMRLLCNVGLAEAEKQVAGRARMEQTGYSMHGCVHAWVLHVLNSECNREWARLAIIAVARHIPDYEVPSYWILQQRLVQHVTRSWDCLVENKADEEGLEWAMHRFGDTYTDQGKMKEAEEMYLRALQGNEKAWGPEHTSTLDTVNNLGNLYKNQGKMKEAEEMYLRALQGYEKAWGPEHTSTLKTVNNLGLLYTDQGKMKEAEEMYLRALQGYEKTWTPEHTSTLKTVNNLGNLYADQGKMKEAEEMFKRVYCSAAD